MWPEVKIAKEENRRELKLSGASARKLFDQHGGQLDATIYQLTALNLLDINDTPLDAISSGIGNLKQLQSLLLFRNRISAVPPEIGQLLALKVLDLSGNQVEELPAEVGLLKALTTVNLSGNRLKQVDLSQLENLIVCNLSGNQLDRFPVLPCGKDVQHLSEINLEKNRIEEIPSSLVKQTGLKSLNIADNEVKLVPQFLVNCPKLKEINLKGNPLKDKRLKKLVDQCRSKQVLDYVEKHGHVAPPGESDENQSATSGGAAEPESPTTPADIRHKITVLVPPDQSRKISFTAEAKEIRAHVLHCVVRDFTITNMKKFLQLQNDLHDNECGRRELATIATHDLAKIKGANIRYKADLAEHIQITPLNGKTKITAAKYYDDLKQQAEAIRKEKKRNTYSGVHKFINLLEGKVFVCFSDDERVISLPPLTNCDETKISPETHHMLLEVTSGVSAECCRKVMLALIKGLLLLDVTVTRTIPEGGKKGKGKAKPVAVVHYDRAVELQLEQVRLYDAEGNFHSVFPGKGDLEFDEDEKIDVNVMLQ